MNEYSTSKDFQGSTRLNHNDGSAPLYLYALKASKLMRTLSFRFPRWIMGMFYPYCPNV